MPGIVAASLLTFIPALGDFVTPDMLGGAQTTTIAKIVQIIFTSGARLAVRLGARLPADGDHDRRHAARAAQPAARSHRNGGLVDGATATEPSVALAHGLRGR